MKEYKRDRKSRGKEIVLTAVTGILLAVCCVFLCPYMTLCAKAAGRPVAISSCTIAGGDVVCQISAGSVPSSDDGLYYIYADEVWQDGTTGKIVASVGAGSSVTAAFPLQYNTADSNLSRKFLVAVKRGGQMVQVSDEHYITNPEAIAAYTSPRRDAGIKGILPDLTKASNGELQELGIKQVVYKIGRASCRERV